MNNEEKNVKNNGGYSPEDLIWHTHSNKLLIKIMELWPKETPIVDIGCGHNFYMNTMDLLGYDTCGFDFVPYPGVVQMDITKPLEAPKNYRVNVLSLEVGEHVVPNLIDGYLNNLTRFGGDVIMSWAIPGQAGIGHINCQTNEWVTSRMFDRGYVIDRDKTDGLREAVKDCKCDWFRNTLMFFKPINCK